MPGKAEERAERGLLPQRDSSRDGIGRRARKGRRNAGEQREELDLGGVAGAFVDANDVAADDVPKLVSQHALDFVRAVGSVDQARVDVDPLSARDEGVDRGILHQHDFHRSARKAGSFGQRIDEILQQRLGLGIAQY